MRQGAIWASTYESMAEKRAPAVGRGGLKNWVAFSVTQRHGSEVIVGGAVGATVLWMVESHAAWTSLGPVETARANMVGRKRCMVEDEVVLLVVLGSERTEATIGNVAPCGMSWSWISVF